MLRSVIVLAFALACVASGCSDERSAAGQSRDTSVLSGAELGWLRSYSSWTFGFYDDELKVGPAAIGDCQDEVERIGPAPTERFEEATSRLAAICPLLERIGSVQRAQDEVEYVDDLLRPYLRDEQPLRLRSGVTDRSRADVVLSDIASDFLGRPVEVRCWDEEDWERVLAEDDAWNDDDHDAEIVGWSADSTDRIHLVLRMCNTITYAMRADVSSWRRVDRVDAIDSIETLAHEIQHFMLPDATEAKAECRAIQSLPGFARRFGVAAKDARALSELYRTVVYPELDDEYHEGGCPRRA